MSESLFFHTGTRAPNPDEARLVEAARHDPVAFGELYEQYLAQVFSYLRARAASDDDAADLAQQVFLRAYRSFPKYRNRGVPFIAWLFRIARNVAIDAHRRRRTNVSWETLPESFHPTDPTDLQEDLILQEEIRQMRRLLATLPSERQEVIVLRFVAGLRLREIAQVIGKSESTVHYQLRKGLQDLKELMVDEE